MDRSHFLLMEHCMTFTHRVREKHVHCTSVQCTVYSVEIVIHFYGGNEHQIGHPGKPKLFVISRKNVSFDSQKIPFIGKSKLYNFSNGACLWQLVLENNRMLHRGLKHYRTV